MDTKFNFKRVLYALEKEKKIAAINMAKEVRNYSLKAFKDQGYNGQPWRNVQRRIPGYPAYKYPLKKGLSRRTSPILVRTGRLRREVSKMATSARITFSKYDFKVQVSLNDSVVPYAKYINKGTENMVKRQFMGNTPALRRILKETLKKHTTKAFA